MKLGFSDNQKFISWLKLVLWVSLNIKNSICSNLTHTTILLNVSFITLNCFKLLLKK